MSVSEYDSYQRYEFNRCRKAQIGANVAETEVETSRERMSRAIRNWMISLDSYPGWREWQRGRIGYTLLFDDDFLPSSVHASEFHFNPQIESQHEVVVNYLTLLDAVFSLRDVEWYFRRYPFSGTPVTRHNHLSYCCELYFSKFYQFRERLKNLLNAVKKASPKYNLDIGGLLKQFDRTFDAELRERNSVHHRERFEDATISRIFLTETAFTKAGSLRKNHLSHYRKAANEWAARVRRRANELDAFVEAASEAILKTCSFLDEVGP